MNERSHALRKIVRVVTILLWVVVLVELGILYYLANFYVPPSAGLIPVV